MRWTDDDARKAAFILRTQQARRMATYGGQVDAAVKEAIRKTADAWEKFAQVMSANDETANQAVHNRTDE